MRGEGFGVGDISFRRTLYMRYTRQVNEVGVAFFFSISHSKLATYVLPVVPFCAVLEIRGDKIAVDRTYADFSKWPGLDSVL